MGQNHRTPKPRTLNPESEPLVTTHELFSSFIGMNEGEGLSCSTVCILQCICYTYVYVDGIHTHMLVYVYHSTVLYRQSLTPFLTTRSVTPICDDTHTDRSPP